MNGKLHRVIVALLLAIAIAVIYLPVSHYGFVIIADSEHPGNAGVATGLSWNTIRWCFTHVVAGNWYPLTMVSHAVDQQIYGSNAGGHHMTNVVLHIANTLLLFGLLLRLLPVPKGWKSNVWPCAVIAALFGLHPLRVESVAWVAERKDVLSGFFFMLTLWAYVRYSQSRKSSADVLATDETRIEHGLNADLAGTATESEPMVQPVPQSGPLLSPMRWYVLALLLFFLGLLAKPMLVTLPFLLLLLDLWPLDRSTKEGAVDWRALVLEKIPFFILSGVFSVITFFAQKKDSLVIGFDMLPMKTRLANSVVSYARYVAKTLWPDSLAPYYPFEKWQTSQVIFATVLFVAISAFAVRMVRKRPYVFVGWFWFAGLLFPVIGISQVAMQSMADRFTYLPHIGLFIFVVWSLCESGLQQAKVALSGLTVAAVVLAVVSAHQVQYWQDSEALFEHVVAVTPPNDITEYFTGLALLEKKDIVRAKYHFDRTLEMNPRYSGAHMRLGDIAKAQGRLDEAERHYRDAVNAEPNATICHLKLAQLLAKKHSNDEAIAHYRFALKNRPEIADAQYQLGQLLNDRHDVAGAVVAFEAAVRVKPNMTDALNDLAWALATHADAKVRDGAKAVEFAQRAVELTHRDAPNILDTLAAAYAEAGRYDDAVATLREAVQKAQKLGVAGAASDLEAHLKLYQSKQPYRENL
jgi:tetratricopeptide (TPR) repeat protein